MCDYFARCDKPAIGTLPNPVLGPVRTCQRCADHVGSGDKVTPFAADPHANCRQRPCPYCKAITIADQGPEDDDTYGEPE